ncbi:MAG: TauD/TfdA dioxygenase family protein [Reyranellaceae bacterium]
MRYETIRVRRLSPAIGARVEGIDLGRPLGNQQFQEIHDALMAHLVLFFPDQLLTVEQHVDFSRRFGEPMIHPAAKQEIEGHPEIRVVRADEHSAMVAGHAWHSDMSCEPNPPMGSALHISDAPPDGGGDTLYANMYAAFDALSPPMRDMLRGLSAIHSGAHVYSSPFYDKEGARRVPQAEHPVVRVHPVTGRECLFVNEGFTTRIVGLSRLESDSLLAMLFRHCETPEFQCRLHWGGGGLALWDNRCAQHRAVFDYWPHRRYGHRVTIGGDKPTGPRRLSPARSSAGR